MAESGLFDKQKSGILRAMLDSNSTFHMTIKLHFYWTSTRRLIKFLEKVQIQSVETNCDT